MEDKLLKLKEVMSILHISEHTLNRYIRDGKFPVIILSRTNRQVLQSDLDNFIKSQHYVFDKPIPNKENK